MKWRTILPILAEYTPDLPLSIEDHNWLFDFPVFERSWLRLHPDLTLEEMGRFMALVWEGTERIRNGTLPDPVVYDRRPHVEEVEERLRAGRDYLRGVLRELGLDRPGTASQSSCLVDYPAGSAAASSGGIARPEIVRDDFAGPGCGPRPEFTAGVEAGMDAGMDAVA